MRLLHAGLRVALASGLIALLGVVAGSTATAAPADADAAPKVRIAVPMRSTTVVSGRVGLRAVARSPSGIRRVEFRVDGKRRWIQKRPPWRFGGRRGLWNTRRERRGVRRVAVIAVDRAGERRVVTRRFRVVRARARPFVQFTRPRPRASVSGWVPWVVQAAADRGIRRVEFRVDGKRRWTQRRPPWRFGGARGAWNSDRYGPGKHRLKVTAIDRRGRRSRVSRSVTVAAPVTVGDPQVPTAPSLPPPTRFVSPDGSDASQCAASSPCATYDRAYQVAAPGEVVQVAAGSYPNQTINPSAGKTRANPVYFVPAPGTRPVSTNIRVQGAAGIEFRELQTNGWYVDTGSDGVTLRNIRSTAGNFITSATNVAVIGGDIGPLDSTDGIQVKRAAGGGNPSDILFDGIWIHDLTRNSDPEDHTDCMQFGAGERVVIRNSRFHNCATQGVFTREFGGGVIRDWVIENNWFGKAQLGYYSLILHAELTGDRGFLVRYNSATQSMRLESTGITAIGNVAPLQQSACDSRNAYGHNVWTAAKCGSTDVTAASGFVNPNALDLRLAPGAAAINAGDPGNFPATDILGIPRPLGGRPDAGAIERQ